MTVNTIDSRDSLKKIGEAAASQYEAMQSLLSVSKEQLAVQEQSLTEHKRTNEILEQTIEPIKLPVVHEARYNSANVEESPKCEDGTRVCIRETIRQWANEETKETLFWLVGPAGTGKSTITRTVADDFHKEKRLAAGYFFKRGDQGRNGTSRLFPTLALQLSEAIPSFQDRLRKSMKGREDGLESMALGYQFDMLFKGPSEGLHSRGTPQGPKIIIIDALDECDGFEEDFQDIIDILHKICSITTMRLRVLLTSRSTPGISAAFKPLLSIKTARSLDIQHEFSEHTKADIQTFLDNRFGDIRKKCRMQKETTWPTAENMARLVQLATSPEPLFIYAATLCLFVYDRKQRKKRNPLEQLELWLQKCEEGKSQLGQIYDPILNQVFGDSWNDRQMQFLSAIVPLATPIPASSLAVLLEFDLNKINWWLLDLHAVLDVPEDPHSDRPIKLLHKSFSDFLLDPDESKMFRVDAAKTHALLAQHCIRHMKARLKRDICDIRKLDTTPGDVDQETLDRCIPMDLKYACLHLVYHLQGSGQPLDNSIYTFFYEFFLHWLEVLSLLGRSSDGLVAVRGLLDISKRFPDTPSEFVEFAEDASRVISSFGSITDRAPLQTYAALLLFSPAESKVRKRLWDQLMPNLGRVEGVSSEWEPCLQTLDRHDSPVMAVAFSPDGQLLASAADKTIHVWNAITGTRFQTLELDGYDFCTKLSFSPDGKILVSMQLWESSKITTWNWAAGMWSRSLDLELGDGHHHAVTFLPGSELRIALASSVSQLDRYQTVQIWNATTNAWEMQRTKSYDSQVCGVAFSPKNQLMASALDDGSIHLCHLSTGDHQCRIVGHTDGIMALAFSLDDQYLASASKDRTVRVWNAADRSQKYAFEVEQLDREGAIAFSPDGRLLASSFSHDRIITLWNMDTGTLQNTLRGHTFEVLALAFSPNSEFLASGSRDDKIRCWDTKLHKPQQLRHRSRINFIVLSPDGQIVASVSSDNSIEILDASTGLICPGLLVSPGGKITLDARFSPDNTLLAVCFPDGIAIHEVKRGMPKYTPGDGTSLTRRVEYSTDGQLVASTAFDLTMVKDATIEVDNATTGEHMYTLDFPDVNRISFALGKNYLASWNSKDNCLWDIQNGTLWRKLQRPPEFRNRLLARLVFSPDSQLIVGEFPHKGLVLWNVSTGNHQQTIKTERALGDNDFSAVAFSPNNQLLVTTVTAKIALWDAMTGEHRATISYESRPDSITTDILFSPNSQLIAAASWERKIRLWCAITHTHLLTLETPEDIVARCSPDGKILASVCREGMAVQLWNTTTGALLQKIQHDTGIVREITFLGNEIQLSISHDEKAWTWRRFHPTTLQLIKYPITTSDVSGAVDNCGVSLDIDKEWITYGSEKLVWLPPEYRPTPYRMLEPEIRPFAWAIRGSTIFIGCESGRTLRFQVQ